MRRISTVLGVALVALTCTAVPAFAATETITESDVTRQAENTPPTDAWVLYTRAGTPPSAGAFVEGPGTPPLGTGSFATTTLTSAEKVYLFNFEHVGTPLADAGQLGYATYRTSGSANQLPALNMSVDVNGSAAGGFTTLVFEPTYNAAQQAVANGTWQTWDADGEGRWWSTAAIGGGQCAGAAARCLRTWSQIVASNPDAVIVGGYGVNQGSGNAGLVADTDAVTIGGTTYDFERVEDSDGDGVFDEDDNCPAVANPDQADVDDDGIGSACDPEEQPDDKDQCKKDGWRTFTPAFKNQGDCVSSVAARDKQ